MKSLFDKYFRDDPPNLDEIFKNFAKKIKNKRKDQLENPNGPIYGLASAVFLLFFIIWFLSGIHIISPSERGVVLRFGAYNRTLLPGPSWVPSIIDRVYLVNVTRDYSLKQKAEMLTKDKNIVDVELSVVFRVVDANKYLFSAVNPLDSVNQATASALRQVVGNTTLDGILTQQRAMVRDEAEKQIIETVNTYDIGIEIIDVNLEPARPPQQVSAAFDDAIKALEDEKRYIN
ncbi:MAG: FtsH protease activity modulator HflK, partial [Legionellales bacterium]